MRDFDKWIFIREIERQCSMALEAFDRIWLQAAQAELRHAEWEEHIENFKGGNAPSDEAYQLSIRELNVQNNRVFASVQYFLVNAALVSKLLWSPPKVKNRGARERRDILRAELQLVGDFTVANTRWRNHLEHMDERLDSIASEQFNMLSDESINPLDRSSLMGSQQTLRDLNTDTQTFSFYADPFDLAIARDELEEIGRRAGEWLTPHMPRSPVRPDRAS